LRYSNEPLSPMRLSKMTNSTLGAMAYHVRTLLAAGVIELADEQRRRGAIEHFYRLVDEQTEPLGMGDPIATLVGLCRARTLPSADGQPPQLAVGSFSSSGGVADLQAAIAAGVAAYRAGGRHALMPMLGVSFSGAPRPAR
jgi:hypothetical protein